MENVACFVTQRCGFLADWRYALYPQSYKRLLIFFFQFSTYIFSADITPEMLKLYVFNFDLFEVSAAIVEKGLFSLSKADRQKFINLCDASTSESVRQCDNLLL